MKHYFDENGREFQTPPDPFHGRSPMHNSDGTYNDEAFREMGGTIEDDGKPSPFEAACAQFRVLCEEIGTFIGDANFKGGFDEYAVFATSEAYASNPVKGNALAIQWSALNELCKYEGKKIGLGQPDWWYRCWDLAEA